MSVLTAKNCGMAADSAETNTCRQLSIGPFQSDLLDLARWAAAFLVVAEHVRSLMFVPYGSESHAGVFGKAFYFLTGFGHASVMVFFVMSGFLVGGQVLERLAYGTFSWRKYVVDRSSRLYAVYLLALLLGGFLDYLGYHYFNRFGLYDRSFTGNIAVVNRDFHANLTPSVFGWNLVMCQTILGPIFGSNGPLWSLANEFWYYLAGPILFRLFYAKLPRQIIFCLGALAGIIWFLPGVMLVYFLVWLLGALVYLVNVRPLLPTWISLVLFLGCFSIGRLQWVKPPYLGDFLIGISFALLINSASGKLWRMQGHILNRKAADFSYSVYLCHFPFLVVVLSALYQGAGIGIRGPRTSLFMWLAFSILALVYLWCYLVSLITERRTPRIRALLHRLLAGENVTRAAKVS
jgi:peptidoglycan/LPS O-acetylase OafA/YrhL